MPHPLTAFPSYISSPVIQVHKSFVSLIYICVSEQRGFAFRNECHGDTMGKYFCAT